MRREYGYVSHPPCPFWLISFAIGGDLRVSVYKVSQSLTGGEGRATAVGFLL